MMRALLRQDLMSFIHRTFQTVAPGQRFQPNWHIEAIAEHLRRCLEGRIKRLIITIPPRHLKSISVSVAFPAWVLGRDPTRRIVCVSYSQDLALKFSQDTRTVMESDWYRRAFPCTRLHPDRNTQQEFMTTRGGSRLATSVGGILTGRGGSLILIDDPHKADEALSETKREAVIHWFHNTLLSRLDSKSEDVIVLVMQRLHEEDLAGYLLEQGRWVHLDLPAIAEDRQVIPIGPGLVHVREAGDILHPEREPREVLEQIKAAIGSYAFAAQYQQRPAPLGGGMVKWEWFKPYPKPPEIERGDQIVQSVDTATKAESSNDYSVITTWLKKRNAYCLLHVLRERLEYPLLKKRMIAHAAEWKANLVLIEDVGAGSSLIQELRRESALNIAAIVPKDDKKTRMMAATSPIEGGRVFVPTEAPWLADFQREIVAFPNGKHDDQVDSLSQFLNWAKEREGQGSTMFAVRRWLDPDYPGYWVVETIGGDEDAGPQLVWDPKLGDF
jgi:predicted phage terminase large subunit-like protein